MASSATPWKERFYSLAVRSFMLLCTMLALIGLGALVFFMCEQGMLEYGITNMPLIYVMCGVGAAIVFLAHVTTWGKASLAFADILVGKDQGEKNSKSHTIELTFKQKLTRMVLIFFALLGTTVYASSSYLGFLSMATALSATGAALEVIKVFGISCCVAMFISGGAFNVYSMLEEMDRHFHAINKRALKQKNRTPMTDPHLINRVRNYRKIKRKYNVIADSISGILAIGNGLGDVIFKAFASSHFLVLIGLATVAATGAITFSSFGMFLLVTGAVSTFVLSLATEGIRMMAIGREISQKYRHPIRERFFPDQPVQLEDKPKSKFSAFGIFMGRALAVFVSILQAIPTFTSSVSKVAGLGAFILWFIPGLPGLALGLSVTCGVFFFISKFIGYLGQSGPYIIRGVAQKTDSVTHDVGETYEKLGKEFQNVSKSHPYYKTLESYYRRNDVSIKYQKVLNNRTHSSALNRHRLAQHQSNDRIPEFLTTETPVASY